ncbi:MAG: sulfatase, partial [Candidatus Hydrogenedentes bacterium]|nr:sulfatase [Candidatus Hydrogenedentota bacterium]
KSDGAQFIIALYDRFGRRHELFDRTLAPTALDRHRSWIPLQLDLAKYSGQTVRLSFEIDNKRTRWGDYACWGNLMVSSKRDNPQDTPVVLISIDTLRQDHLSCYGYERDTSPNLSKFAMESVVFDNAITQDVWTPTSHMTMLTGLYPKNHGLSHTTNLAEETLTLPELLREAGYLTAGYTGHSWWLLPWRGFAQGFDVYDVPDLSFRNILFTRDRVSQWLDKHSARNFFLFFHNYDCHSKLDREGHAIPYLAEAPEFNQFVSALGVSPNFDRADPHTPRATDFLIAVNGGKYLLNPVEHDHMIASYDDAIRMVDHSLGELFDELRQRDQYNNALIIVTADHGESFREHGRYLHEQAYEDSARVPLLIKFPGNRYGGRRVEDLVHLTDLFPTIADVLGLETPAVDGASLVPMLEGDAAPRGHAYTGNHTFLWQGLREGDWKLLFNGLSHRYELYDLAADPGEQRNLYEQESETAGRMRAALEEFHVRPNYGWHIFLQGGEGMTELKFSVVTQQQFSSVQIVGGEPIEGIMDRLTTSNDQRTVTGKLFAVGRDQDEIVLETLGGENEIFLNIESETEFEILVAGRRLVTNHYTETLTATDDELPKPELDHGAGEKPVISLWYDPPPVERSAAQPLSEEAIQDLEALGYITGEE